jgi:hypothetical protein
MAHCATRCTITVVCPDNATAINAVRAGPGIVGGILAPKHRSADGYVVWGLWCTTVSDAALGALKRIAGVTVHENSTRVWKDSFTARPRPIGT